MPGHPATATAPTAMWESVSVGRSFIRKKRKKSVGENLVSERETLDDEARSILADAAARRGCHASIAVKTPLEWLD